MKLLIPILFLSLFHISYAEEVPASIVSEEVKEAQQEAESELIEHEKLAKSAELKSQNTSSLAEKALADYLAELQKYRAGLSEIKLVQIESVNKSILEMRVKSDLLHDIEMKAAGNNFTQATDIWRNIVDRTLSSLFETSSIVIKEIPGLPAGLNLDNEKHEQLKEEIKNALVLARTERAELISDVRQMQQSERKLRSELLLVSGRVRSKIMNKLISTGKYSPWDISANDVDDYIREFKIVPFKFLATLTQKYFELNSLRQNGAAGWLGIFKQSFLLLFIFGLPFLVFKLFRKMSSLLENTRKQIFTKSSMDYRSRTRAALWIGRLNPYLPWLFAYLAIVLANNILANTILEPLALILPYLNIYVGYRAFRVAFGSLLAKILLSKNLDAIRSMQPKVESTAYRLSVLFFLEWAVLHATQDAVRQALIYNITADLIVMINVVVVTLESRKWKPELVRLATPWIRSEKISAIISVDRPFLDLIICPALFAGNSAYLLFTWAYSMLSQFEVGKKISSEIFKKRLEEASDDAQVSDQVIDESYRKYFEAQEISKESFVRLSQTPVENCLSTINKWKNSESTDDLIMLYGNFGIGKTAILNLIESKISSDVDVKRVALESRITKSSELYDLISKLLGKEVRSASDLESLDASLGKTLVMIDDIHYMYLNEVDGLAAYRNLIALTSLQLENIFWLFTCNERALAHLNGIFGKNHFLGKSIELMSWTDAEIQDLILKRHGQSQYRLKYDDIISAVHKGDVLEASSGLDVQFFRMLWGQSRGNPKTAQELWLTATQLKGNNEVRVGVPDFTNARDMSEFNDETLLLYANIVKHENLNYSELKKVSKMERSVLKQALKLGEDAMVLQKIENKRWRVHPKAQYVVNSQLAGRNLIYG